MSLLNLLIFGHNTHAHSADAVLTDARSSTTTSTVLRASCVIAYPLAIRFSPAVLDRLLRCISNSLPFPFWEQRAPRGVSMGGTDLAPVRSCLLYTSDAADERSSV